MERADAVCDASFWINAERSGILPHLPDFFRLWIPPLVFNEIAAPSGPHGAGSPIAAWSERGVVQYATPQTTFGRFDAGENQAIALAIERGWALLIDDAQPRHFSRGVLHLTVVDSPAFTVLLYDRGRLSYVQALDALTRSTAGRRLRREALLALAMLKRTKEPNS